MKKVGITLSAGWWKLYEVSKTNLRDLELKISLEVSGLGYCGSKSPIIRVLESDYAPFISEFIEIWDVFKLRPCFVK